MKKYIKPQTKVTIIETMEMLCQSGEDNISKDYFKKPITNSGDILSKEYKENIWGLDDDDDEY